MSLRADSLPPLRSHLDDLNSNFASRFYAGILKLDLNCRKTFSRMCQIWLFLLLGGFVGPGEFGRPQEWEAPGRSRHFVAQMFFSLTAAGVHLGGISEDLNTPAWFLWHQKCANVCWARSRTANKSCRFNLKVQFRGSKQRLLPQYSRRLPCP